MWWCRSARCAEIQILCQLLAAAAGRHRDCQKTAGYPKYPQAKGDFLLFITVTNNWGVTDRRILSHHQPKNTRGCVQRIAGRVNKATVLEVASVLRPRCKASIKMSRLSLCPVSKRCAHNYIRCL